MICNYNFCSAGSRVSVPDICEEVPFTSMSIKGRGKKQDLLEEEVELRCRPDNVSQPHGELKLPAEVLSTLCQNGPLDASVSISHWMLAVHRGCDQR